MVSKVQAIDGIIKNSLKNFTKTITEYETKLSKQYFSVFFA